jgi:hypothetical protein
VMTDTHVLLSTHNGLSACSCNFVPIRHLKDMNRGAKTSGMCQGPRLENLPSLYIDNVTWTCLRYELPGRSQAIVPKMLIA